jgi:hypothetical protein
MADPRPLWPSAARGEREKLTISIKGSAEGLADAHTHVDSPQAQEEDLRADKSAIVWEGLNPPGGRA